MLNKSDFLKKNFGVHAIMKMLMNTCYTLKQKRYHVKINIMQQKHHNFYSRKLTETISITLKQRLTWK